MSEPLRGDAVPAPDDASDAGDAAPDDERPGLPPPTAVESLVSALLDSGPEVAEHVVKAAQELLLAAQAIVDAADRAVREQQEVRAERNGDATSERAPLRHLDLAE